MKSLPRVALGPVQPGLNHRPVLWALLERLQSTGIQSQCFYSQSRFADVDGVTGVTGRSYRHLDSWLMSAEVCREVLEHGMASADLAVVENANDASQPNSFDDLCSRLELPRLMVVDTGSADPCRLPARPKKVDGVFLSSSRDRADFNEQRLRLETLWNIPVFGGLVGCAHAQAILNRLPASARPSAELCRALGDSLASSVDLSSILDLAAPPTWGHACDMVFAGADQSQGALNGLRVAVALDDAFGNYFADTLDLLEVNGATLRDFSPLHDAELPRDVDVVYMGCGHVERFAEALSDNACMIAALRRHARSGGRIYAEGGAAAYLCNQVELATGLRAPMCGILPAIARHASTTAQVEPVEIALPEDCWLGRVGDRLRGYRNSAWRLEPLGPIRSLSDNPASRFDLVGRDNVIASRIHLNMAAQPHLLASFAAASAPATLHL